MNKTIIFVVDDLIVGGVTSLTKTYADALKEAGFNVIIIGKIGNIEDPYSFFYPHQVFTYNVKDSLKFSFVNKMISFFQYSKVLRKTFRKEDSICAIHSGTIWLTFFSYLHPQTWMIPRFVTFHGFDYLEKEQDFRILKKRKIIAIKHFFRKTIQIYCLRFSTKIIVLSNYSKTLLTQVIGSNIRKKIVIIPGCVGKVSKPSFNNRKPGEKTFTILNIGRAEPRKGIDLLLQSVHILKNKGYKLRVIIAGPIDYLSWTPILTVYEKLNLLDTVQFVHKVNDQQKIELMKLADVFVIPSVDLETFGLSMIESMSRGLPVIGFCSGAIPDIIGKVDKRLIAKKISAKSLAKTLENYINLSNKQKQLIRAKSVAVVNVHYSYSVIKKMIQDFYNNGFKKIDGIVHSPKRYYFDFLVTMTLKEVRARYKHALLGFLWMVLNPLLQMLVIGFVFQFFLPVTVDNYFVFLFTGLLPWNFFSLTVTKNTQVIVFERYLIKKASFPREVIPLSIVLSNAFHLIVSLLILFLIVLIFGFFQIIPEFSFTDYLLRMLLLVPLLVWLISFVSGLSLLFSALNVRFRDVNFIIRAIVPLWFYATPIVYTLDLLPKNMQLILFLNPMTGIITLFQFIFANISIKYLGMLIIDLFISVALSILGWVIFKKESPFFEDWV